MAFLYFLGSKTFPKDSRNGRGRRQSGICFDRWGIIEEKSTYYMCIFLYICLDIYVCDPADEVESLAAARKAALSGSEPSDSIRVNSLPSTRFSENAIDCYT